MAVGVQPLGNDRPGTLHLRAAPAAVEQRRNQVGGQAGHPIVEEVADALGRRVRGDRQTQLGELVRNRRRHESVGRLHAEFGGSDVRSVSDPLSRQARSRQGGQCRKLLGRPGRHVARQSAQQHVQLVLQGADVRGYRDQFAPGGLNELPLLQHVGGGALPAPELQRNDLQVLLVRPDLLAQQLPLPLLLGQQVPRAGDVRRQRDRRGSQILTAGVDVQPRRVVSRPDATPQVHLVARHEAQAELRVVGPPGLLRSLHRPRCVDGTVQTRPDPRAASGRQRPGLV